MSEIVAKSEEKPEEVDGEEGGNVNPEVTHLQNLMIPSVLNTYFLNHRMICVLRNFSLLFS